VKILGTGCLSLLEDIQIIGNWLLTWLFRLSYSFGSIVHHCVYGCVFCVFLFNLVNYMFFMLLFNFVNYIFVLYVSVSFGKLCICFVCFCLIL
jgi:hypothetical protein